MKLNIQFLVWLVPALILTAFVLVALRPLKAHNIRLDNEIRNKRAIPYNETWLDSVISRQVEFSGKMKKVRENILLNFISSKNQDSVAIAFRNLLTANKIELQKFNYKLDEFSQYNVLNLQLTAEAEYEGLLKVLEHIETDFKQFKISNLNIRKANSKLQFSLSVQAYLRWQTGDEK